MGKQTPEQVRQSFWRECGDVGADVQGFADDLFRVATNRATEIDGLIEGHAQHWRMERMAAVDRNLMRAAVAELMGFPDYSSRRGYQRSSRNCTQVFHSGVRAVHQWRAGQCGQGTGKQAFVSRQSSVLGRQPPNSPTLHLPNGTSGDARAHIAGTRRLTTAYGLTAIKSGLQVKGTPLQRPDRRVVASVGKESC